MRMTLVIGTVMALTACSHHGASQPPPAPPPKPPRDVCKGLPTQEERINCYTQFPGGQVPVPAPTP